MTDGDCPDDGVCLALEGDPAGRFVCYAGCVASSDCYAGFACTRLTGASDVPSACLP